MSPCINRMGPFKRSSAEDARYEGSCSSSRGERCFHFLCFSRHIFILCLIKLAKWSCWKGPQPFCSGTGRLWKSLNRFAIPTANSNFISSVNPSFNSFKGVPLLCAAVSHNRFVLGGGGNYVPCMIVVTRNGHRQIDLSVSPYNSLRELFPTKRGTYGGWYLANTSE